MINQKRMVLPCMVLCLTILAAGCVSSPAPSPTAPEASAPSVVQVPTAAASAKAGPFYRENIGDFEYRTLSNGIRVYVKKNAVNRVLNLKLVFRGGSALVPANKAGLEGMTLELLGRGSASYPYEKVMDEEYRTSSSISFSTGYDYSTYELNCIDKYLPELLDFFLDGFQHPAFDPKRFEDVRNEVAQVQEARMGDPEQYARFLGTQAVFSGHPYASDPSGTPASVDAIALEDVRGHHEALFNADRIFVVAVGNYDVDALAAKLEAALGQVPRKGFTSYAVAPAGTEGPLILQTHPASQGVAYIQGYFRIPGRADKDYVPFAIAADMLDDLFFNVVREKHGACYSVGNILRPGAASYGIVWIYQATDITGARRYVREASDILAGGRLIRSKDPSSGEYILASIADRLPAYRNKYVNSVFAAQRTNADTAAQIVRGVVYANDPADYLRMPDRIEAVTPADIQRVFKTWFLNQGFRWVVVSDEAGLNKVPVEEYK